MRAFRLVPFLLLATLALAACDTAEERAEGHYQRALALSPRATRTGRWSSCATSSD